MGQDQESEERVNIGLESSCFELELARVAGVTSCFVKMLHEGVGLVLYLMLIHFLTNLVDMGYLIAEI